MYEMKRLHPAAVLENLIKHISALIQFLIGSSVVIITATPLSTTWLLVIISAGLAVYIIFAILSWLRFKFVIYNNELRIEQGIFARRKTYIPAERIQSIQLSAGIVQRIFGLVKVEVQTAGGDRQAEASLSAISKAQALELQAKLRVAADNKNINTDITSVSPAEKKLTTKNLIIAATTSNGIGVVLIGMIAFISQINQYIPDKDIYTRLGDYLMNYAGDSIFTYIVGISIILILAWLFSILGTIINVGGFSISRYEDRLIVQRGLIEKRQINIPLKRIQAVKIVASILRQPFGLATIHVISAGHGDKASNATLVFPLLSQEEINAFLENFLPEFEPEDSYMPLSNRAKNRYRMIFTIPALLIVLPLIVFFKYAFLALLLPFLGFLWGSQQYRNAGWQITGEQLAVRFRILGLNTFFIRRNKIQYMELQQNPFQKKRNLTAFAVMIASNVGGNKISLKGIDTNDGNTILDWFNRTC